MSIVPASSLAGDSFFYYLATPYAKHPGGVDVAAEDAARAAAILLEAGVPVFCPIAHSHPIAPFVKADGGDHAFWLPKDQPFLEAAKGLVICQLVSWRMSVGVQREFAYFCNVGKPVYYMKQPHAHRPDVLRNEPWPE